ncbi:tetratricopeptide repeat protein [Desulfovibrio sp.]|uniref:tetratricopeptide repeat protein n=1 Tax=Desulfovibrio sp. TaxID=885 RepID=UPI0023C32CE9|nr:tetratricopeptide repeat protein [Desulfovibrio sp.]MDE7241336.1 tetratricopeptide repeat protein [Desulfovibrio sp.]
MKLPRNALRTLVGPVLGAAARLLPARFCALVFCACLLAGCGGNDQASTTAGDKHKEAASTQAEDRDIAATVEAATRILKETPRQKALPPIQVRPVERELSPDALGLYAYLRAVRAILDEDEAALLEAALVAAEASTAATPVAASTAPATEPAAPAARAGAPATFSARGEADQVWPTQVWLDGGVWLMSRKSPNAVTYLEQALKAQPEDLSLNLLLAEALGEHGMAGRGVKLMRAYLARHPGTLDARLELALLLVKEHEFSEAEKLLTDIPAKERTPLVEYYHAKALAGMERKAEAIPLLRRSVRGMPDFVEALAELAFLLEQEGELREARSTYEKLAKFQFSPQDVSLRLVNLSLRLKQPEKALQYINQGPDTIPFKLTAVTMLMDARHYLQAERLLKQLTTREGAPDDVYLLLADLAYEQRRDLNMALSWLDKIPAGSPIAVRARLLRVQLLAEAGKPDAALALARESHKDFPRAAELRDAEIRLLARQKQMDEALAAARKAAAEWPDNTDLAFLLGSLLDENGKKQEALTVMEDILKKQPDNFQALNYVGYSLAEQNRELDRALQLLTRADALAPDQSYIIDSLAWALFRAGKAEEALTKIRRAVSLEGPVDATIWEHYGDIARHLGHTAEARRAYQKALDLKPANADALRQRLAHP